VLIEPNCILEPVAVVSTTCNLLVGLVVPIPTFPATYKFPFPILLESNPLPKLYPIPILLSAVKLPHPSDLNKPC